MEYAIWNEGILSATEIADDFELECKVRRLSEEKQLKCPDVGCQNPIVRYCHGEKKVAYFAHLNNSDCDYGRFDKNDSSVFRNVRLTLLKLFRKAGINVKAEQKVLPKHYCQLLFEGAENGKVAVEFGTEKTRASKIERLEKEYRSKGLTVKWLFIGDISKRLRENKFYYLKRYLLNSECNKQFLTIRPDCGEVAQYRLDSNSYSYNGKKVSVMPNEDIYFEKSDIENLEFINGDFLIRGFDERHNNWLLKKEEDFNRKVAAIEPSNRAVEVRKREQASIKFQMDKKRNKQISLIENEFNFEEKNKSIKYYPEDEISENINQQNFQVRDSSGRRWIKCECCGKVALADDFHSYGGPNHVNLGVCEDWFRRG